MTALLGWITITAGLCAVGAPPLGTYVGEITGLREPRGAAFGADGTIYVADAVDGCVVVASEAGEVRARWSLGPGSSPVAVAIGGDEELFVADAGVHEVLALGPDGAIRRRFGGFGDEPGRLAAPCGLAFSRDRDELFVADSGNRRVTVFDAAGRFLREIGGAGRPVSVALDGEGMLYVADGDAHAIHVFDQSGTRSASWGEWGTFPGLLCSPAALAVAGDRVFVAERLSHRVQVFDRGGQVAYQWGMHALVPREGRGRIHYPSGLAVEAGGGRAVVCEGFERRCQLFGPLEGPPPPAPLPPRGQTHYDGIIAAGAGLMAAWEPESRAVTVFDLRDEIPIQVTTFGDHGRRLGEFGHITAMAFDGNDLWIADAGNRRLVLVRLDRDPSAPLKFDPFMARFVKSISLERIGRGIDGPIEPAALLAVPEGLLVLDGLGGRVLEVDRTFLAPRVIAGEGWRRPSAIAVDRDGGRLAVVDRGARSVRVFAPSDSASRSAWEPLWTFDTGLVDPWGAAFDEEGLLFVSDSGADAIVGVDEHGREARRWGETGGGWFGELWMPRGLAIDERGRVIVMDYGNHRGRIFSRDGQWLVSFTAGTAYTRERLPPPGPGER
jgi:DNA-binding beta-propeller fold protein YncE